MFSKNGDKLFALLCNQRVRWLGFGYSGKERDYNQGVGVRNMQARGAGGGTTYPVRIAKDAYLR